MTETEMEIRKLKGDITELKIELDNEKWEKIVLKNEVKKLKTELEKERQHSRELGEALRDLSALLNQT